MLFKSMATGVDSGNTKIALNVGRTESSASQGESSVVAPSSVFSERVASMNENGTGAYHWLFCHTKEWHWRKPGRPTAFCDNLY